MRLGERRYIDTGSGWRMQIPGAKGPGSVRLTAGEAAYVEDSWRADRRSA